MSTEIKKLQQLYHVMETRLFSFYEFDGDFSTMESKL